MVYSSDHEGMQVEVKKSKGDSWAWDGKERELGKAPWGMAQNGLGSAARAGGKVESAERKEGGRPRTQEAEDRPGPGTPSAK